MSQHHPLMSPTLYTPHGFGMRDRPDTQENFDTHFHHSSTLTLCAGFVFFLFYSFGKRASKSDICFILLCMSLGDGGMGWRHTFSV